MGIGSPVAMSLNWAGLSTSCCSWDIVANSSSMSLCLAMSSASCSATAGAHAAGAACGVAPPSTVDQLLDMAELATEAGIAGLAEVLQTATLLPGWIEPKLLQMMCILPCYTMLRCPCYTMPQSLCNILAQTDISTHTHSVSPISEAMVKAVLSHTKNVSFPGVKRTMMFKHDDQGICDGVLFVRLSPRNRSLISMVREDNPNAPKQTPTTATCCKALAGMKHMRNKAQSEIMKPAGGCILFSNVAPKEPTSKPRVPRPEKKRKRANCVQ